MLSYQDRLKQHLAAYKRDVLGETQDGIWSGNGRAYPHILAASRQELNVLPGYRDRWLAYLAKHPEPRIALHKDFHHLNSSQAMAFNLFLPVGADRKLSHF